MSEIKHTPGPWEVGPPDGTGRPGSVKQYRGQPYQEYSNVQAVHPVIRDVVPVAHVYQGDAEIGSPDALAIQRANARLIAAAPCLLAALEWLVSFSEYAPPESLRGQKLADARAAIAKAKGEDQ